MREKRDISNKGMNYMGNTINGKNNDSKNMKRKIKKMSIEEKKSKKKKIKIFFIILLLLVIFAIAAYVINDFVIIGDKDKTSVVINNKDITQNMKNSILFENDIIYMSKNDIQNFFDKYITIDEKLNKVITTSDKKVAEVSFESNIININGSNVSKKAHAITEGNVVYLPISEMTDVYDIEVTNISQTNVLTIDSKDREQKKAIVRNSAAVKSTTNFIAKTVDRVNAGDYVIVVENIDNGFTIVRTENGKVGYLKTDNLANEVVTRESMEDEAKRDDKICLYWDYYSEYAKAPNRNGEKTEGVNVVSPAFFHLTEDGKLTSNVGTEGRAYIEWAHNNGYKVWPMVSNAEAGIDVTSQIMNSYGNRKALIENLVEVCVEYNLDGLNIDFENMKEEDKNLYSRFIIELTPRIKEIGDTVSVDVTAPDGADTWSLCFDRNVIGDVADYIVFMAYDEYGVSSNKAGTTAGYDWVKLSLEKFLTTEEIESNKIILAIPFYTRMWTEDSSGKATSKTVTMKGIDELIPNGVEKKWDENLKQYYIEYKDGNNTKKMWLEEEKSITEKISLIFEKELAGIGCWEKDMEDESIWKVIAQELKK